MVNLKNLSKLLRDRLVVACFVSNLFYSAAYPSFHTNMISNLDSRVISFNSIMICLSGIIVPILWNRHSDSFYKKYGLFCILETVLYILLCITSLLKITDYLLYYILDTMFYCFVTKNILIGTNRLKVLRYEGDGRQIFDNNIQLASNASSLIGFSISFITIPMSLSFILITIGIIFDNFFYYSAWKDSLRKDDIN